VPHENNRMILACGNPHMILPYGYSRLSSHVSIEAL
jgi:hypothetical protein